VKTHVLVQTVVACEATTGLASTYRMLFNTCKKEGKIAAKLEQTNIIAGFWVPCYVHTINDFKLPY